MGAKVKIMVSEHGEVMIQIRGEEGWHVFGLPESMDTAHKVIAGQTNPPRAVLSPPMPHPAE